ncbi:MAG: hypothetical protein UV82_C0004G0017 [Candidatus Magasanikbacteria bacterium GW2011_GWD2_43_18]|nr:MAG: hypothetical protein UV18_C0001G0099 [Candidatus Magasanikbacteria bacterium GW2011_GWC2_42_27]KKT04852.1 MAG: hypothetical protein UV82_C0004G0017 [Candidatus Magasanikbacteria bacterium GW2011_GWD2_43_18]KKT23734.1 MAG: hypothetical protein UW10_C0032G0004 [Candidatus Magasanikbacteria bacterium GW2011_GWA2_43_9]
MGLFCLLLTSLLISCSLDFAIFNSPEEVKHMSEIKRKKGESFEAFMRRTKQSWRNSGSILQARKIQYFIPSKSKNVGKKRAVKLAKKVSKFNYLKKTGKLPVDADISRVA